MTNLIDKKCVGHDELVVLGESEIKNYLLQLKEGWSLGGNKIKKQFTFEDFVKAMEFVNKVAVLAEEEGHHPDIAINYSKVEITLSTHFVKGLSENDFILAVKIDNI